MYRRIKAAATRIRAAWQDRMARIHPEPIFVLGNQKSGTTAIASLLAECTGNAYSHDMLFQRKVALADLMADKSAVKRFVESSRRSFEAGVIKDPHFTFIHAKLAYVIRNARFIMVVRDPRQNIRSILNRSNLPGDRQDLRQEEYAEVLRTQPGWHDVLSGTSLGDSGHYIDVLAKRWNRAADAYLPTMKLVRYEDFDAAKKATIEGLARSLTLLIVNDIASSVDRQFQPRGNRDVTPEAFFGKNLERIERLCGPRMKAFGYS